jgi:hypothetical protein
VGLDGDSLRKALQQFLRRPPHWSTGDEQLIAVGAWRRAIGPAVAMPQLEDGSKWASSFSSCTAGRPTARYQFLRCGLLPYQRPSPSVKLLAVSTESSTAAHMESRCAYTARRIA